MSSAKWYAPPQKSSSSLRQLHCISAVWKSMPGVWKVMTHNSLPDNTCVKGRCVGDGQERIWAWYNPSFPAPCAQIQHRIPTCMQQRVASTQTHRRIHLYRGTINRNN